MIQAQEYLDQNYPQTQRKTITNLNLCYKNLQGSLGLADFPNLEELYCNNNQLTSLNLDNCLKLRILYCFNNYLTDLSFLAALSSWRMTNLNVDNNNFPKQDLAIFSRFVNLESLFIDNDNQKKINQGIYNRFAGSLEPLKNLTKLKILSIENTDIDSGLEYLPKSVTDFWCSANQRSAAKCKGIYNLFADEKGEIETDFYGIKNLSQKLQDYKWKKLNFTEAEIKQWIIAGAKLDDYKFVAWFRDTKKLSPEWITNYQEDYQILSQRFKKYGLCSECKQLNTGEQWCQSCNSKHLQQDFPNWTSQNSQIDKFIQKYQLEATEANKLLEWIPYEQFFETEKMKELQIINSELQSLYLQREHLNKSKLKQLINKSKIKQIKKEIDNYSSEEEKLTKEIEEKKIEFLAEGGFGKVYKAKWRKGNIRYWDTKKKQWARERDNNKSYREVVLKSLNNSSTDTDFLDETAKHKIIDDWFNNIVPCYGLSQDPNTGNYLMVMKYIEGGNLRHYLNSKKLTFQDKLKRLTNIIQGLKDVHSKNLVHRDFHSGNILNDEIHSFITDLGLCKPVDEANQEEKIFGVLPYVAPEVLRNKGYTPASDIYSLGMVAYEIFANASPYLDSEHDSLLAAQICQGLRPNVDDLKIPPMLKDLIKQCWDSDPAKRPTASEIERTLRNWQQDSNFGQQIQAIEKEYNQESQNTEYKFHPTASMNSKLINTKEITQLCEQYSNSLQINFEAENNQTSEPEQIAQIQQADLPYGQPSSSQPK